MSQTGDGTGGDALDLFRPAGGDGSAGDAGGGDGSGGSVGAGDGGDGSAGDARPDIWEAVHGLAQRFDNVLTELKADREERNKQKPIAGVQDGGDRGSGGGGGAMGGGAAANPVLMDFQARVNSGEIKTQADAAAFWDREAIARPGWAMMAQIAISQGIAEAAATRSTGGIKIQQAEDALATFRREHLSDPVFQAVRQDFDELIEAERAAGSFQNLSPQQIADGIPRVYEAAVGRATLRRAQGNNADTRLGSAHRPPLIPITGGGGFGDRSGTGNRNKPVIDPQNDLERQIVQSGRDYKLSDADIADALRQHREEMAG